MLKLLGGLLIIGAGTMFGFYQSMQLSRRPRQIRELIHMLQRLETEIGYGSTPLSDALLASSKSLSEPVAALFRRAAEYLDQPTGMTTEACWRKAVVEGWRDTAMKAGEREVLLQLGHSLGITDREDQLKHLRLAVNHLLAEEEQAAEDQRKYAKMWKSLGALAGALIVILVY
ncbi:stage III sporulation protein SpoIIIAB [Paenibacillus sp. 32O-W]|uniref:stage III sporulation protein SpoIIIAB n=1 Tax=Paenibacillus sp. 32O-W TaxID=1695218 RepID=UPI0011A2563D|nr:stage III sporulation protein SpoIIIAB [Paenibacillus sp. 32O-W]